MGKKFKLTLLIIAGLVISSLSFFVINKKAEPVNAEKIMKICSSNEDCYIKYFKEMVRDQGSVVALKNLENIAIGKGTLLDCHNVAHYIGQEAYKLEGGKALNNPDRGCSGGYLHGVADAAAATLTKDAYAEFYTKYCLTKKNFQFSISCVHGLGHTLYKNKFTISEADLICNTVGKNIKASVRTPYRDAVSKILLEYSGNCADGFTMEAYTNNKDALTTSVSQACSGFSGYNLYFCLFEFMRTRDMADRARADLNSFKKECEGYSDKEVAELCAYYVGENVADLIDHGDTTNLIEKFVKICSDFKGLSRGCIVGFTTKAVSFNLGLDINKSCEAFALKDRNFCTEAFKRTK